MVRKGEYILGGTLSSFIHFSLIPLQYFSSSPIPVKRLLESSSWKFANVMPRGLCDNLLTLSKKPVVR